MTVDDAVRIRFLTEARVLASLDHPHMVKVLDFIGSDRRCLFVMELLAQTLSDRKRSARVSPQQLVALAIAACDALGIEVIGASGFLPQSALADADPPGRGGDARTPLG